MANPAPFVTMPGHVRGVDFGHAVVLVNYRNGQVSALPASAGAALRQAAKFGSGRHLPVKLLTSLLGGGLLVESDRPRPWRAVREATAPEASWGGDEFRAGLSPLPPVPRVRTLAAAAALAVVHAVKAAGPEQEAMGRVLKLVHSASTAGRRSPATTSEAAQAVHAARSAGRYSPGRTNCLEESAAAMLLLHLAGKAAVWRHGVAPDPIRLHAWIETVDGTTVAESASVGLFTTILSIPGALHVR
ncbi:lasso peptide biosynthesis B2 protein [Kitasatospora sp. MBT66]|uniref:lasso peptide biosynthesis B2 protein n=1 Tax=Kitasatospora sp. MBT66 TaxID=1444769 RepID=UPI001E4C9FCD|nr:lasso peptide biosynthesis B2 protein [Kitasatospora sp. MBT66]